MMDQISNLLHKGLDGLNIKEKNTVAAGRTPYWNKGSGFSNEERDVTRLRGLIPSEVEDLAKQEQRALNMLDHYKDTLDQYIFLSQIRNTNTRLFFTLVINHFTKIAPLIYTPVVGKACQEYSHIQPFLGSPGNPDGLFISYKDLDKIDNLLDNYRLALPPPQANPEIAVITDGSRILGLGDLGMNGMGIPIGKLQLYIGAAGINPSKTLPITLDFGTDTQSILDDPLYMGLRQKRPDDKAFYPAVDKVLKAVNSKFPGILIQFEDFSSAHAFELLEIYQNKIFCFNDDIQGTGAVILSGFINAVRLSGVPAEDHRIVFLGAGSAGIGVATQIMDYFINEAGMKEADARRKFWLIDSKGLITTDRGDKLSRQKSSFARDDNKGTQYKSIEEVIDYVKPTALIGLSSIGGSFNMNCLKKMKELNSKPIVFPLSNPATNAECSFEDAMKATDNKVIFASGTGFPDFKDESGKVFHPGQGNNMYIFPGLGLGAILSKCGNVSDKMIYAAAASLANSLTDAEKAENLLYPDLHRIRAVSARVAAATIIQAHKEGKLTEEKYVSAATSGLDAMIKLVEARMWHPVYRKLEEEFLGSDKMSIALPSNL